MIQRPGIENNMTSKDGLLIGSDQVTEVDGAYASSNQIVDFQPMYPGKKNEDGAPMKSSILAPKNSISVSKKKSGKIQPMNSNVSGMTPLPQSKSLNQSMNNKSFNDEGIKLTLQDDEDSLGEEEEITPEDEKWKDRKCFWQMNEQIRIRWDLFVMILATWN